jgi:hypothetical protein
MEILQLIIFMNLSLHVLSKCTSGQYFSKGECLECPCGEYNDNFNHNDSSCKKCPKGLVARNVFPNLHQDLKGSDRCEDCGIGMYTDDSIYCKSCPIGTYKDSSMLECNSCPSDLVPITENYYTGYLRSTKCAPCIKGKHSDGVNCVEDFLPKVVNVADKLIKKLNSNHALLTIKGLVKVLVIEKIESYQLLKKSFILSQKFYEAMRAWDNLDWNDGKSVKHALVTSVDVLSASFDLLDSTLHIKQKLIKSAELFITVVAPELVLTIESGKAIFFYYKNAEDVTKNLSTLYKAFQDNDSEEVGASIGRLINNGLELKKKVGETKKYLNFLE